MVFRRELGGNAVGEKSVAEGTGVGYGEICSGLKNPPHRFRGDFEKRLELYCILMPWGAVGCHGVISR